MCLALGDLFAGRHLEELKQLSQQMPGTSKVMSLAQSPLGSFVPSGKLVSLRKMLMFITDLEVDAIRLNELPGGGHYANIEVDVEALAELFFPVAQALNRASNTPSVQVMASLQRTVKSFEKKLNSLGKVKEMTEAPKEDDTEGGEYEAGKKDEEDEEDEEDEDVPNTETGYDDIFTMDEDYSGDVYFESPANATLTHLYEEPLRQGQQPPQHGQYGVDFGSWY